MKDETAGARSHSPKSLPLPTALALSGSGNDDKADGRAASVSSRRCHNLPLGAELVTTLEDTHTSREQLGWEMRTTRVLAELLQLAAGVGLPPIAWTVGCAGANLAGRCYGHTGADRRCEFEAWCPAVAATPQPEFTDFGGVTHLRAIATRYDGLVDIVVLADVYADDESAAGR